jgi:hypothetical protein
MFRVTHDLLKYDGRFRIAFIFLLAVVLMVFLSLFSPYDPNETFVVPMDVPPSSEYFFGTNSRGQDIFWWMTFAVRNSLLLGVITAVISRVIAILVGLSAGYEGGWLDRVLMSVPGVEPEGALIYPHSRLFWDQLILDHDQRAPSLRVAYSVCHHHQQHAVVNWNGSHFERSWTFGSDHAQPWNRALLG